MIKWFMLTNPRDRCNKEFYNPNMYNLNANVK